MGFKEQLNEFYRVLDGKAKEIKDLLAGNGFKTQKNYFNGHFYNKDAAGNYVMDYYPIPVIEVEGLCDIEVVGSHINISTKLAKKDAIRFNYDLLNGVYFEVYGVIDYLADYYKSGENLVKLFKNLEISKENEIGFAFSFANETPSGRILNLIALLKANGFYY